MNWTRGGTDRMSVGNHLMDLAWIILFQEEAIRTSDEWRFEEADEYDLVVWELSNQTILDGDEMCEDGRNFLKALGL